MNNMRSSAGAGAFATENKRNGRSLTSRLEVERRLKTGTCKAAKATRSKSGEEGGGKMREERLDEDGPSPKRRTRDHSSRSATSQSVLRSVGDLELDGLSRGNGMGNSTVAVRDDHSLAYPLQQVKEVNQLRPRRVILALITPTIVVEFLFQIEIGKDDESKRRHRRPDLKCPLRNRSSGDSPATTSARRGQASKPSMSRTAERAPERRRPSTEAPEVWERHGRGRRLRRALSCRPCC